MCLIIPYKNSWYLGQRQRDGTLLSAEGETWRSWQRFNTAKDQKWKEGERQRGKERKSEMKMEKQVGRKGESDGVWGRKRVRFRLHKYNMNCILWEASKRHNGPMIMSALWGCGEEGVLPSHLQVPGLKPGKLTDSEKRKMFVWAYHKWTNGETVHGKHAVCLQGVISATRD